LAITDAGPLIVNVHDFVLRLPLEQAPDQIASRPFETDSVTDVPLENDAEPVLPTATLIPAGLDPILLPDRPVAVTVNVPGGPGGCAAGVTVKLPVFVAPKAPVIVTIVGVLTPEVVTANVALVAPAAIVTLPGTPATFGLLLERVTVAPEAGAAFVRVADPCDAVPPVTVVGLSAIADNVGPVGGGGGGGGGGAPRPAPGCRGKRRRGPHWGEPRNGARGARPHRGGRDRERPI